MCRLVTTASGPERRSLEELATTTISAASIIGQDVYDLLVLYFEVSVEVDAENGPHVQVMPNVLHAAV